MIIFKSPGFMGFLKLIRVFEAGAMVLIRGVGESMTQKSFEPRIFGGLRAE